MSVNFKTFIKDIYSIWQNPKSDFRAILYSPRNDFDEIEDIEYSFIFTIPNRVYLFSRKTKEEIQVYDHQLQNYKFENDMLILNLDNKEIRFQL